MKEPTKLTNEEISKLEFHPLANLFPLLQDEELQKIVDDIKVDGFREHEQIVIHEGKILDGRNRYKATQLAGYKLEQANFRDFNLETEGDPYRFVISKNIYRRHLTKSQCAAILAEMYDQLPKREPGPQLIKSSIDDLTPCADQLKQELAATKGIGVQSLEKAAHLFRKSPLLHRKVKEGKMTLHKASQEFKKQKQGEKAYAARALSKKAELPRFDDYFKRVWDTRLVCPSCKKPIYFGVTRTDQSREGPDTPMPATAWT
jgi:hypothetical protein